MNGCEMVESTRREFLLSTGAVAATSMLTSPALAVDQEQQGKVQTEDELEQISAPAETPPDITNSTFAEAEKLIGIEFTDAEREVMVKTIGEQLALFKERLKHPFHPNTLAPALTFDPRLPGMNFESTQRSIVRSNTNPGAVPGSDENIAFAPVTQLSRWIEQGQLTSRRLTEIYLERLKRFDPKLECVITLTEDLALEQSDRADREVEAGKYRGPLHGIPWGAKDLLATEGIRTTWGAEPHVDRVPESDATVVKKLTEAGAVLVAKLTLGALAYNDIWFGGRTNNPWNPEQGSSGSSAGSAAATAAGLVGFSIGTETYGSIVSPCMRCGTTGLRPTFGRVSRHGAMALCWSLDKIGPICRTVEDCALVLDAIKGYDAGDASSIDMPFNFDATQSLAGLRVGFSPKWFDEKPAHDLDRQTLEVCRSLEVKMVEVDLPDRPYQSLLNILFCEAAAAFEDLTRTNVDDTLKWQDPEAWPNTFRRSWFIPGIELVQADRFRRQCMQMMAGIFENVDVIIAPSFAASLLLITNNTGHPSLTLRCGFKKAKPDDPTSSDVPHGITLIGDLFDEGSMSLLGMALEKALEVWQVRPDMT